MEPEVTPEEFDRAWREHRRQRLERLLAECRAVEIREAQRRGFRFAGDAKPKGFWRRLLAKAWGLPE